MGEATWRFPRAGVVPGWGASIIAGAGAGVVAALATVAAEIAMHAQAPPRVPTMWSAFVAGVLGGVLYGVLGRVVRRPGVALSVIALVVATIDSLLIATLPLPSGPNPKIGIPIAGLEVPLRQLLALVGIGHLGTRHYPAQYLPAATATHYITALAVSLLVPWWAKPKS